MTRNDAPIYHHHHHHHRHYMTSIMRPATNDLVLGPKPNLQLLQNEDQSIAELGMNMRH